MQKGAFCELNYKPDLYFSEQKCLNQQQPPVDRHNNSKSLLE